MSVRTAVVAMAAAMATLAGAQPAAALGPLPWCFSTLPFGDILVLSPAKTSGGQRDGTGIDLAGARIVSVNTFVQGSIFTIGYTIYPQPGYDPVFAGGTINAATGSGPGECFSPGFFDCGEFTFQKIACPSSPGTARVFAPSAKFMGKR